MKAFIESRFIGTLFENTENEYVFEYEKGVSLKDSLCLSMPSNVRVYISKYHLHPFFDSFLPEGYLFEVFKNMINKKEGRLNDFLLFYYVASGVEGRVSFKAKDIKDYHSLSLEDILKDDSWDSFQRLLRIFLYKNAISGVQPKTITLLKDKASVDVKEYVVKTFGDEYPNLAENEYFCMKILEKAKIPISKIYLSYNKRFLVIEKFTKSQNGFYGFEEMCSLLGKTKDRKYDGSYEQIAKIIKRFSSNLTRDLEIFYKMIVLNFLLKNGDAHLKNFGLLYEKDFSKIWLAPAYDVICTIPSLPKDKPALFMHGTKSWHPKQKLIEFGIKHCNLNQTQANLLYQECEEALKDGIKDIELYLRENHHFKSIGNKMISTFKGGLYGL